jgi:uncharacterized membrane protein YeaQ/YmgE (transglycosylase-associated protein family)
MIYIFLFWILPAILCGYIAEKRNRSTIKGVLVGVFFGWVGCLIVFIALGTRDKETGFLR